MKPTLLFDLFDVCHAGLNGLEVPLSTRLGVPPETVLPAFRGFLYDALCSGLISEDTYLRHVCESRGWSIDLGELKSLLRENFQRTVPGMDVALLTLAGRFELVLFAEIGAEWAAAIHGHHGWLNVFSARFYSYELRLTKRDPRAYWQVLGQLEAPACGCVVVDHNAANVRTAAAAGLAGICFTDADQLARELEQPAARPWPRRRL